MLALRIDLAEPRPAWTYTDGRWHGTAGAIQPFVHPCLTTSADQSPDGTFRLRISSTDGDALTLHARAGAVTITAGTYATAPLFLTLEGCTLHGSWDMAQVARLAPPWHLRDRQIAHLLSRQPRYTADTPCENVHRLTAGATATVTARPGRITIAYPEPTPRISQRRRLRTGVDPVAVFDRIIKTAMASYVPDNAGTVGTELSGGADSATVALSARALLPHSPLYSFGLQLPGPGGDAQSFRRLAYTLYLGLTDCAVPATEHLPFNPAGHRFAGPHDPASPYYGEAFNALARNAAQRGVKVMLTGFGADELMRAKPDIVPAVPPPAWLGPRARAALAEVNENVAPPGPVSAPTLMACASHSPAYLRAGVWLTAPFAHPAVSRFARQLPPEWAAGKRLLRARLARAGLPRLALKPRTPRTSRP